MQVMATPARQSCYAVGGCNVVTPLTSGPLTLTLPLSSSVIRPCLAEALVTGEMGA